MTATVGSFTNPKQRLTISIIYTLHMKAQKNDGCFSGIEWKFDRSWMDHWLKKNDSVINIYLNANRPETGNHRLNVSLSGCQSVSASKDIYVLKGSNESLSDASPCVGDS